MPERPPHSPEEILVEFRETRAAILARHPRARFLVFWDLDGTILCGDCSEGLQSGGRTHYPGLVQVAIELGLSAAYAGPHAHLRCMSDYAWLRGRIGAWMAYPFLAQVFAGAREEVLLRRGAGPFPGGSPPVLLSRRAQDPRGIRGTGWSSMSFPRARRSLSGGPRTASGYRHTACMA